MKCKIDINDLILFDSAIYEDGTFWTIPNSFKGLVGINAETGKITDLIPLCGEKPSYGERLITAFSVHKSRFFFLAGRNVLVEMKGDTKEINYITLPVYEECVRKAIFCNGYLCMFFSKSKKVVVINIENLDIKMEIDLGSLTILDGKEMWSLFWSPIVYDEKVYIACQNTNSFLTIDLKNFQWDLALHNDMQDGIQDVCITESNIFLLGINGSVKKINVATGSQEFVCQPDKIQCQYSRIIYLNGKLWLLPQKRLEFCLVTEDGQKRPIFSFPVQGAIGYLGVKTSAYDIINEYIYVYPRIKNCFIKINTKTLKCEKLDLEFAEEIKVQITEEKYFNHMLFEGNTLMCESILDLKRYIQLIYL